MGVTTQFHVTLMLTTNACGDLAPNLWIHQSTEKFVDIDFDIDNEKIEENFFVNTEAGFIDVDVFVQWANIFIAYIKSLSSDDEYHILITDGHNSRLNPEILLLFWKNKIIVVCLPSHLTHLLQSNDSGTNRAYKSALSKLLQEIYGSNGTVGKDICKSCCSSTER